MVLRLLSSLCFLALVTVSAVSADTFDIGFNDDSFQLAYETELSEDTAYGATFLKGRFLYNDDKDTKLGSVGLDFVGHPGNIAGLGVGVGVKLYGGKTEPSVDFINLGVGLNVDYVIPQLEGLGVSGRIDYAPKVFSFRDAERLVETEVRLTYAVIPKVRLFLGYQNIRLDVEDRSGDMTIDDSVRIGFVGSF